MGSEEYDHVLPEDQRRLAVTIVIEDPQMWTGEDQSKVHAAFARAMQEIYGEEYLDKVPYGIHLAISRRRYADLEDRIRLWTGEPEEDDMGMVKHGEGSVVPENEQQKQGSKEGLTKEAVDEIVAEGREDDDGDD